MFIINDNVALSIRGRVWCIGEWLYSYLWSLALLVLLYVLPDIHRKLHIIFFFSFLDLYCFVVNLDSSHFPCTFYCRLLSLSGSLSLNLHSFSLYPHLSYPTLSTCAHVCMHGACSQGQRGDMPASTRPRFFMENAFYATRNFACGNKQY